MKTFSNRRLAIVALAVLATFAPAAAQTGTGGAVSINVGEPSGAAIPDATLEILN